MLLAGSLNADAGDTGWTVRWLPESLVLIQRGGGYGRMIRLQDSRLLCVYSHGRQVWCRTSRDEGRTWEPGVQATHYPFGVATNAEALQLRNGTILLAVNGRPDDKVHPFTIQCLQSTDGGATWSAAQTVYEAGTTFQTGCWEPAMLELPGGTVHLYFANEAPFPATSEQEIALVTSPDAGASWTAPRRIIFRARHRDGMPVPLALRDGKTLVVAIEDNGLDGDMKPVLCRTTLAAPWDNAPIGGASPDRWNPLANPLPRQVYAGAPYLCQTTAGHTVLSFQYREHPAPDRGWSTTFAAVCVGDPQARQFGEPSYPFAAEGNPQSIWNSVFAKGPDRITLVSSATIRGTGGLWAIDGQIVPQKQND